MATAGISPEFARIQALFGGSRNEREQDQNGLPSEDEDGVLKNLAAQTIQPYRPGWAALPGVASSIVGGMAAAKLRENNQIRQAADRNAWGGYMKSIMPAAGGAPAGMAGPPAVASASPVAPVAFQPQPQFQSPAEARPAIAGGGGYQPQPSAERPAISGMAGPPHPSGIPQQDRAELSAMINPGPSGMAGSPAQVGQNWPAPAAPTPPATGASGGQPQAGDPRLARFDRELAALAPMLQNPGTRAFAMQRLQALEAARARIDDPDNALDRRYKEAQIKRIETDNKSPQAIMQQRMTEAKMLGMDEQSPAYKRYVLTGQIAPDALAPNQAAGDTGKNIASGIDNLARLPDDFSDFTFENATGPMQGDDKAGILGTAARAWGSLRNAFGSKSTTEVRSRIAGDTEALAAAIKPLIRKPGEGAWTDADQARLVSVVGNLALSRDKDEYNRALEGVRQRVKMNFGIDLPRIGASSQGQGSTSPPTALKPGSYVYDPATGQLRPR